MHIRAALLGITALAQLAGAAPSPSAAVAPGFVAPYPPSLESLRPAGILGTLGVLRTSSLRSANQKEAGDELWGNKFGLPAIDGLVECATIWNGSLIIGGQFSQAGGVPASNIARWDGTRWNPLDIGFDGEVLSLVVYEGDLVAGGRFRHAGPLDTRGVARWNGFAWTTIGPGLDTSPYDLPARPHSPSIGTNYSRLASSLIPAMTWSPGSLAGTEADGRAPVGA